MENLLQINDRKLFCVLSLIFWGITYTNDNQIYLSTFDYTQTVMLIISSRLQNTTQTTYIYIFVFGIYFEQHINTFDNEQQI